MWFNVLFTTLVTFFVLFFFLLKDWIWHNHAKCSNNKKNGKKKKSRLHTEKPGKNPTTCRNLNLSYEYSKKKQKNNNINNNNSSHRWTGESKITQRSRRFTKILVLQKKKYSIFKKKTFCKVLQQLCALLCLNLSQCFCLSQSRFYCIQSHAHIQVKNTKQWTSKLDDQWRDTYILKQKKEKQQQRLLPMW